MRERSDEEKRAMGLISPVFRELHIKQGTRGYMPLVDLLCYAYAQPQFTLQEIMQDLISKNDYIGVKAESEEDENESWAIAYEKRKLTLYPSMKRCIATALEKSDEATLSQYGLKELTFILKDGNIEEEERIKREILNVIGNEYSKYQTYEERVIAFFSQNILSRLGISWE